MSSDQSIRFCFWPNRRQKYDSPVPFQISVILKVRRTVAKVQQKLSWTDKIILIVGPIDRLTYAKKYFIFGKFSNNCHRKFSLSSWKIPFLFLKYCYGDFSNCQRGILNPYLYYAFNNESCMAKFQAIICHRSFGIKFWY